MCDSKLVLLFATHTVSDPEQILALLAGGKLHYLFLGLLGKCWMRFLHNSHIGLQGGLLNQIEGVRIYTLSIWHLKFFICFIAFHLSPDEWAALRTESSIEALQGKQVPDFIGPRRKRCSLLLEAVTS